MDWGQTSGEPPDNVGQPVDERGLSTGTGRSGTALWKAVSKTARCLDHREQARHDLVHNPQPLPSSLSL